jgi:WD40 repeat protein
MVAGSLVAPKVQGRPLKITTVKPWVRACFAQSPSNSLQFLISDGRRASLVLPTGKVVRDLHGLEACRDKIVRVSASHDGSCVVALTSEGHCWLHNCALGQSQEINLPPEEELPFQFSSKVKRQQLWDVQLEACAATSLVCFSWLGSGGNLMKSMPFAHMSTASNTNKKIIWAKHEEQTAAGAIVLCTNVYSAAIMALEGWLMIEAIAVADLSDDSWKIDMSCSLFCIKDGASEPTGSRIASFSFPSPFSGSERSQLGKRDSGLHSSRYKPAIIAVHGGEGLIALVINCASSCLYFFNIESSSSTPQHPKICLPLDSGTGDAQEFVCDAAWVSKGWWLVLLLSTGRLLVLDRRGILLSWAAESAPGAVTSGSGTRIMNSVQMPSEMLSLSESEWTVSAHPLQPYVAVCTGFYIAVVVLPSPSHFVSSSLSVLENPNPSPEWAFEYAFLISRSLHVSSQPSCAMDMIVVMSHLWCLALSNPVSLEISIFDKLCKALSSSLVSAAAVSDSKRQVLVDSLRAFLTAGHQATYLCPHSSVNQSHKLDFACIQVIVSSLVDANASEDAAVLLCACRKRCDVARSLMLRPQYITCVRFILNIWNEIAVKELRLTAASETTVLQGILAAESISLSPIGSFPVDRKNEAMIARAIEPSVSALESAVCLCRAGQSVAALSALINGGHLAAVVAATLRLQGVLTGSSCTAVLSAAINGKCWKLSSDDMFPCHDVEECKEESSIDDCLNFILKTCPRAAVHCVVRCAAAVCALSLCTNSDIELMCLHASQCVDTQSEFMACPVFLRLRLSTDPSIVLGNDFQHKDSLPISVRSCSIAFKDILTESCNHDLPGASPPLGLELAWVLCLLAGCGPDAALLAVASVEIPDIFASLLSFCDSVSAAAALTQTSPLAARVDTFKASVCDWMNENVDFLSSFFLSPANIELLQFCSSVPNANLPSQISLVQNIDRICAEAVKLELLNLFRNIAGDHNVVLNSNIKDVCTYLSVRSRSVRSLTRLHIVFLWAVIDSRRSAFNSLSGSLSSKLSVVAMTKAQLLLEFSITIYNLESSFLDLSATFCVDTIENALRSGSGLSISREHLLSNVSLLCLAVRKGAISEQRHKLRAIAQSIKSFSAQASSMINSLFESESSGVHDAEFEALEADLKLRYESLNEAQSLSSDNGTILELKTSADLVLGSLSEELWVCHSALMASCFLSSKDPKVPASVVIVPHLFSSNLSSASSLPKILPEHDLNNSFSMLSQNLASSDRTFERLPGQSLSVTRSLSPKIRPSSPEATHLPVSIESKTDVVIKQRILSPREQPPRVFSKIRTRSLLELPAETCESLLISSEQLLCPTRKIDAHESAINTIVISSDGTFLFSAGDDQSIKKWQLDRCFCVKSVPIDHAVSCLVISLDGIVSNFHVLLAFIIFSYR